MALQIGRKLTQRKRTLLTAFSVFALLMQPLLSLNIPAAFASKAPAVSPTSHMVEGGNVSASRATSSVAGVGFEKMKVTFHYNAKYLDKDEKFLFGIDGDASSEQTIVGLGGDGHKEEEGDAEISVPESYNNTNFDVYFINKGDSPGFSSRGDDVSITGIVVTGSAIPVHAPADEPAEPATPDTTAPTFAITSPANGSTVRGEVAIRAKVVDESGIDKLLMTVPMKSGNKTFIYEKGKTNSTLSKEEDDEYVAVVDTTAIGDGPVHVVLRGTDGAGNTRYWNNNKQTRQHMFAVNNTSPVVSGDYFRFKTSYLDIGFTPSGFTDATSVVVGIYDEGDGPLATQTLDPALVAGLVNGGAKQVSAPFYLDNTVDAAWQGMAVDWTMLPTPAYAVVTIYYGDSGEVKSDKIRFIADDDATGETYDATIAFLKSQKETGPKNETPSTGGGPLTSGPVSTPEAPTSDPQSQNEEIQIFRNPIIPFGSLATGLAGDGSGAQSNAGDEARNPEILGSQDNSSGTPLDDTAVLGAQDEGKMLGLSWQWWLVIVAALIAGWLALAAVIRRLRGTEI